MEKLVSIAEWVKRRIARGDFDAEYLPAEQYYASIYRDCFKKHLQELGGGASLRILDVGCGTGRFLMALARDGHRMTGMDYHRDSYRVAKEKVDAADLDVELHDGNLKKVLPTFADDTFDAALSIEVLHTSRDLQADLAQLFRVVRPGGLLMITHRPKFYNIARCLAEGCPEDAVMVATTPQGRLKKAHHRIHYNWQSRREIETLYRQLGGTPEVLYPIGTFSGFLSDPLTTVCDPGTLDARQQAMLRQIETGVDDELLMASRYVLAVVRKNESSTE